MTSRSDCEPLPKPTLSPSFALARPGTFLRVGFFTAAVWCVPALRVPLVHSLINHFRQNMQLTTHELWHRPARACRFVDKCRSVVCACSAGTVGSFSNHDQRESGSERPFLLLLFFSLGAFLRAAGKERNSNRLRGSSRCGIRPPACSLHHRRRHRLFSPGVCRSERGCARR